MLECEYKNESTQERLLLIYLGGNVTNVVFMGSADFSVPSLLALRMAYDVVGVVSQPDRPAGRGRKLQANPVKRMAEAANLPIFQPERLRGDEAFSTLAAWRPDVIVVVAYGQILQQPILDLPPHGCVNVHASLLPRWRGAAPITAAILDGDVDSGVTIMKMDAGMDTGPILAQRETVLEIDETTASLSPRLAEMGAQLLLEVLPLHLDGEISARPQPELGVTLAPPLSKADGRIDWSRPADAIDRQVRAYNPWPGAFTTWNDELLKIWEVMPIYDWEGDDPPGTVVEGEVTPLVATGEGALWVTRLQAAGKKTIASDAFLRGRPDLIGARLGDD